VVDDYVIVGAGSAGCVLAARLSEDPDVKVTLIEAGPPDTAQEIHIPVAFAQLFQTKWDWDYLTDPEPGLDGRRHYLPRGKMLGGSSSMNAMIYIRGNPADYAEWEALGAGGWGWEGVLPYFLKAEDNQRGASPLHGVGGPLTVSDGRSRHVLMDAFLEAAEQAGHQRTEDFNGPEQEGVGYYQLTPAQRAALQRRRCLPAPGDAAGESDRADRRQPCLSDRGGDVNQRPDPSQPGAAADPGPGAVDLQHRRGGRVPTDGRRPAGAGCPAARGPGDVRR
jgi:choline dehydrogenase-like flavoprotein